MGLRLFSSSFCDKDTPNSPTREVIIQKEKEIIVIPNPNKYRWSIVRKKRVNDAIVVEVRYHDCVNYGGVKILVYDNYQEFEKLMKTGELDPHFSEDIYSPVARLEPTIRGWALAEELAKNL